MRLACVIGTYPTPSETFIAREMEGLRARGHDIVPFSLFQPDTGPADGVCYGWETEFDRFLQRYAPRRAAHALAARWRREFAARRCEAVMAHFGSLPSSIALDAAENLPLVVSLHARDLYVEAQRLPEKLARARAIVTCTRANQAYLQQLFPAQAGKIHLVYHGLPADWTEAPVPERARPPQAPLRILAAGRLVEKKGFRHLLAACAELQQQGFPFQATILGDGPQGRALVALRRTLGLQDVLALEGWVNQEDLRRGLAWADVFCCPSVMAADGDRDGLPNVLLEAMASGLPVVASRLSGIPEAVEDSRSGLLAPPADPQALALALSCCADPTLRLRLGSEGRRCVAERFQASAWLTRLEELLTA